MKTKQFYLYFSLVLFLGAGVWIWQKSQGPQIPQLLDRKGGLSLSSEWKNTRQAIETLRYKILKNPEDYTSKLMLAHAFMQEARVT